MSGSLADDALRLQWGALLVSVLFHVTIFFAYTKMDLPETRTNLHHPSNSLLRIHAELISPLERQLEPTVPANLEASEQDNPSEPQVLQDELDMTSQLESAVEPPSTIDYTTPYPDATPVWITPDAGPQTGAFGDVFDPRLRLRLQNNRMHKSTAKPESLAETRNIHGDLYVDLGNGRCMMANQAARSGEPTNWYMTSCGSGSDEGEQMLKRVKQNWRKRGE